jgi:lysyl-tRNA synthetase, class II
MLPKRFPDRDEVAAVRAEAEALEQGEESEAKRRLAGRVMSRREHGKLVFLDLVDRSGRLQLFCAADRVDLPDLDVGDIVGVAGSPTKTRRGEPSLAVDAVELLAKIRRPLPDTFHGLTDTEARYRRRYLDLLMNEDSRRETMMRARIVAEARAYLDGDGFVEVETPILQPRYGGAFAEPFVTHSKLLGGDLYLRIADELYLKRLIVGGLEKVYELGKDFRNEGISYKHSPEFTQLEWYEAYADYQDTMERFETLVERVAHAAIGGTKVTFRGHEVDLAKPWQRVKFAEALEAKGVWSRDPDELRAKLRDADVDTSHDHTWAQLLDHAYSHFVEPELIQPTIVHDWPIEMSPFARTTDDDPTIVERFECVVSGMELANAFSELNDAEEQAARFAMQGAERAAGDVTAEAEDPDYIEALSYGMPPTGGLGVGIDRLAMVLEGKDSIRDVILFPMLGAPTRAVELALPRVWSFGPHISLMPTEWWERFVVTSARELLSEWASLGLGEAHEAALTEAKMLCRPLMGPFVREWDDFARVAVSESTARMVFGLALTEAMAQYVRQLRSITKVEPAADWTASILRATSSGIALLSAIRVGGSQESRAIRDEYLARTPASGAPRPETVDPELDLPTPR